MVWYIRFLKTPKLHGKRHVQALITVTTDLGDDFYPQDISLYAMIVTTDLEKDCMSAWQTVKWKSGMRCLWINIDQLNPGPSVNLRLVVNSSQSKKGDSISLEHIPEILGVWSDTFDWVKDQASNMTERRFRMDSGERSTIVEETGESIARHIWDAGIAMTAFLGAVTSRQGTTSDFAKLLRETSSRGLRILELGSGCGIVGLQASEICSESEVLLTDLPEAMDILNHNVDCSKLVSGKGRLATVVLDWDQTLPRRVAEQRSNLVIVSDCTYNPDSIPGLVKTLSSVAEVSPDILIVVSLKRRHDSEAVFFELMGMAEFVESWHTRIPLPDQCRRETGRESEVVEIYVYRSRKALRGRSSVEGETNHSS